MDVNASVTMQPGLLYQINLAIPAIAAIISATLVGIVSYYANKHLEMEKARIADNRKRRQIYSQLKGQKFAISQAYVSRYEAFIYFQFERARYIIAAERGKQHLDRAIKDQKWTPILEEKISEKLRNHPAGPEGDRLLIKAEDLEIVVAKNQKRLFEILGQIEVLFPDEPELRTRIDRLNNIDNKFKARFDLPKPFNEKSVDELDIWAYDAVKDLVDLVRLEIEIPIDELLQYLKYMLNKNNLNLGKKAKWRFWKIFRGSEEESL